MSEMTLYKPNEFIGAIDKLEVSRTAKHLLNFFLQYAQHEIKFNNHVGTNFEINVLTINGLADLHVRNYARLKQSLQTLMQPVVLRDDPKQFIAIVPISDITIDVQSGMYRFELTNRVCNLLKNCDYFTKLQLREFNNLQSKHSITIYEWLKRWETAPKGIQPLPIDELRRITNTENKKTYDNFTHIQIRILDVAVNEINQYTPYQVSYDTIKERAKFRPKVTAIQFYFSKKEIKKEIKTEAKKKTENAAHISSAYEKLRKVCGRYMTLKFYYNATYIYHIETLEQFADDCAEKNYHPNKTKFFEWLDERCSINQKGYYKQYHIYSEKFFKSVFSTEEIDPSSVVTTDDGREMWLGGKIKTVHEEYVSEAMKFYGELPYNEYKHYLSGIWQRFQQQFNVNEDNVFE
jgi:plasmid replication initiation protein